MESPIVRIPTVQLLRLRPDRRHGILPAFLYCAGSLEALAAPAVAIVGTRAPSAAGRRLARTIACELGRAGGCVVSGLARGIDAEAHAGALDAQAPTVGVLAGGHDRFYPREHRDLAERMIAAGGAVVSAHPGDAVPYPARFLERNGIIVALVDAVVIVEAPLRSGALNTASWSADANIPVLAIPGDVDRPKVAGCLALIRDGAILARGAADVLEALGLPAPRPAAAPRRGLQLELAAVPATLEDRLLALLAGDHRSADELALDGQLPVGAILAALMRLQIRGAVAENDDGRWQRLA